MADRFDNNLIVDKKDKVVAGRMVEYPQFLLESIG